MTGRMNFFLALCVAMAMSCPAIATDLAEARRLVAEGALAEARSAWVEMVAAAPDDPERQIGLADVLLRIGDLDGARDAVARAEQLQGEELKVGLLFARLEAARGDRKSAIRILRGLVDLPPGPFAAMKTSGEFESFRDQPEFQALLAEVRPCRQSQHRQFDFWTGTWRVERPDGGLAGHNTIRALHDGCTLREDYVGASGLYSGSSLNFWDSSSGRWHQTWIDNQGGALFLSGGLVDGNMVLSSESTTSPINRISWSRRDGGRVRQHWEVSVDGGSTWSTVFDGLYVPVGAEEATERRADPVP